MPVATKKKKVPFAKLKGLRAEHGLSQAKMAEAIGICEGSYRAKEAGKRDFSISEAKAIGKYFGLPVQEIFFN